jgi:hypothetical protein
VVTFGGGIFVAVGANKGVYTSMDGMSWSTATGIVDGSPTSIAYGYGMFLVLSTNGSVSLGRPMYNTIVTWYNYNLTTATGWGSIAIGNNISVALNTLSAITCTSFSQQDATVLRLGYQQNDMYAKVTHTQNLNAVVATNNIPAVATFSITFQINTMYVINVYSGLTIWRNGVAVDSTVVATNRTVAGWSVGDSMQIGLYGVDPSNGVTYTVVYTTVDGVIDGGTALPQGVIGNGSWKTTARTIVDSNPILVSEA